MSKRSNAAHKYHIPMSPDDIISLFRECKIDKSWSFSEYKPSDTSKWTHDYHRYPAKFIPQLVERLLDEYISAQNAHINDPFMGCGTSIVSAISRGFRASGTDINRIAYLITKVKSQPIEPSYLETKLNKFASEVKNISSPQLNIFNKQPLPLIPETHLERINYWFSEQVRDELGKILRLISQEEDYLIKDFLTIAFSNILKTCSIWLQGSTKPTRDFNKKPVGPSDAFRRQLNKMKRGNSAFYSIVPDKVRNHITHFLNLNIGDARNQPLSKSSVDLVITSSPYVTSYEYADLHQLSTIWLDLAKNLKDYKKDFIGTCSKEESSSNLKSEIGENIVNKVMNQNKKMAKEIQIFFSDMQAVLDESYRILKHGGRCCYVIGNTKLKGIDILNAEVFAESMLCSNFLLDRIIKREIPLKILPQKRDEKTGRFASNNNADSEAYPVEYIVVGLKN